MLVLVEKSVGVTRPILLPTGKAVSRASVGEYAYFKPCGFVVAEHSSSVMVRQAQC